MPDTGYTYWNALAGGVLIGLASFIATAVTGKIPGISGLFGRLFRPKPGDTLWRVVFLVAMVGGAACAMAAFEPAAIYRPVRALPAMAVAGLLVGVGTRVGGGCTSGHGVCGTGLGARDSMVATGVFMAVAIATVFVAKSF
ncbi:YeeE/YedE family protein [soil metagenome]